MEKVDLFNLLVRYLAVKPLKFDKFDLEQAKEVIKVENQCCITFMGEHGYMEDTLDELVDNIVRTGIKNGTVYLYIKGQGCTERLKRKIVELLMNVHKVIIFGDPAKWPVHDPRLQFVEPDSIFEENHQRFFVFQSPGYNVALVARHNMKDGEEVVEAAMSNVPEAVSFVAQVIGTRAYQAKS